MNNIPEKLFAIFITVIMISLIPLISFFQRQDDVTYNYVYNEVNMFVDETLENGYITPQRYEIFALKLGATGNTYDIMLQHDEKLYVPDPSSPNGFLAVYEGRYNMDILNETLFSASPDNYYMEKGDLFTVHVINTSTTHAEAIHNSISNEDLTGTINIRLGGMVSNEGY